MTSMHRAEASAVGGQLSAPDGDGSFTAYDDEPAFRKEMLRLISEMQRLSWEYSSRHGAPTFFQDRVKYRIPSSQMIGARLIGYRGEIRDFVPDNAVLAEIGTWKGEFAQHLITTCKPQKIYTFDLTYQRFDYSIMQSYIDSGLLSTVAGDSSSEIEKFPEEFFDFIYVDGDHSYDGIKRDAAAAWPRLRKGGLLVFNDYTNWSVFQFQKYGTMAAVGDFASEHGWPVAYLALDPHGYHDIAFRRPA